MMLMMISVVQCHCLPIYNNIDRGLEGEDDDTQFIIIVFNNIDTKPKKGKQQWWTCNSLSLCLTSSTQDQEEEDNKYECMAHRCYECVGKPKRKKQWQWVVCSL